MSGGVIMLELIIVPTVPAMNFFKDGAPKYLCCYEKKRNPTVDRFTVVFCHASKFMGNEYIGRVYYVSCSGNPTHPLGFYQHGEARQSEFCPCGSRIAWWALPEILRNVLLREYCDVWGIDPVVDRYGNVVMAERRKEAR
jgi:hypothetical protein